MRNRIWIAALAVLTSFPVPSFALSNLTVQVNNAAGSPLARAEVMAVAFANGNPDAANSRLALTDATGKATFDSLGTAPFSALTAGVNYQILASSQGFLPALVDQFNAGLNGLSANAPSATPTAMTIVLSSAGVSSLGEIGLNFANATPNSVVFGQVSLKSGGGAIAYGATNSDGTGAGTLTLHDIHYASSNTYQIGAFDPVLNRSVSATVGANLDAFTPSLPPGALPTAGFTSLNAAPPASAVDNTAGQGGTGLGADVVVVDTITAAPIAYAGVSVNGAFKDSYGQWHYDNRGGGTDASGHLLLYGLTPQVTYYLSVFGTCGAGSCYLGSASTAVTAGFGAAPGPNDFLYKSTTTVIQRVIQLKTVAAVTSRLAITVRDQNGNKIPHAGVSLYPDWTTWFNAGSCTNPISNPGLMNLNTTAATGYLELSGIPSGNYMLNAWTQFGPASFNNFVYGSSIPFAACTNDRFFQYRLTIDTATTPNMKMYNGDGAQIVWSSTADIVVNVPTSGTGLVQGSLTFPSAVDLSRSPVLITLYAQCSPGSPCNNGGFQAFSAASTGPVINYSIPVSSGQAYWMSVNSDYWGAITAGGSQLQVDLRSSTAAYVPLSFVPAGRLHGSLRAPDGSVFVPQNNQYIWIGASGNNSWGNTQLAADGSFDIGGLLPGEYHFEVGLGGGGVSSKFPYTMRRPEVQIQIAANQTTLQDAPMDNAVGVQPSANLAQLPPVPMVSVCPQNSDCPPQTYEMFALPAGTPLSAGALVEMLADANPEVVAGRSKYNVAIGSNSRCDGAMLNAPGFCPIGVPARPGSGSTYDFFLTRKGGFDSAGLQGGVRPHLVMVNASSSVIVAQSKATTPVYNPYDGYGGSTSTVQGVDLTPTVSQAATPLAVLFGTFTISNMITQQQFNSLGGKFNNFLNYLPVLYVYDASGAFKAAGLGVPFPPALSVNNREKLLNQAVGTSDYAAFKSLTALTGQGWGPLGYEIRGLTAGTTYNLVATSPNYPPYKTTVMLGAAGSTTTLNVNFDLNPGSTLSGVVTTTASAALANVSVTVSAPGYPTTTVPTDPSGRWSLSGLSAGQYSVAAVAAGYVPGAALVSVGAGTSVTAPVFALVAANASVSGTVYTNNPVCPAGSTGCAAFGRTAIAGATVVAYDDTLNVNNPTAPLPLFRAVTGSSGTYTITGLSAGETYKLFVNAPGYYVLNQSTLAVAGNRPNFDFALKPKPLTVDVYGHPVATNYEFTITNYKQFSTGQAWIGKSPFTKATSTDVSTLFHEQPDAQGVNQLLLDYPLASLTTGLTYVMHLEAQPNDPRAATVTTEVQFGLNLPHNTCQNIDQALLGDESSRNAMGLPANTVPIDISGGASNNPTALSLPAGGVIPILSTAIPSMCMNETDASASAQAKAPGVSSAAFASGVYTMTLSSVNYTQKGVDLTLSYDQNGTDIKDLAVYTYNSATQKWDSIPGLQTLDPVKGTITVKGLKSLSSVLGLKGAQGAGLMAVSDGRGYRPSAIILRPDDTGVFAVMKPSQVPGGSFTGTIVKVYNFPNPFSLQTKSVSLTASSVCSGGTPTVVTDGTVIKYEIPSGISGTGVIRIYTLSGRLVREVDAGNISPNSCYYTTWDGKNKNGQPVANGVYYGVLSVGGSKQSSGTFKLAVIK